MNERNSFIRDTGFVAREVTLGYIGAMLVLAFVIGTFAIIGACSSNLHKPTTAGNAGTTALVAYSVAGAGVGQYLALPLCATPPVYPCKTQVINDRLMAADTAAYNAAMAANSAGNDPNAAVKANKAADELRKIATEAKVASTGGH